MSKKNKNSGKTENPVSESGHATIDFPQVGELVYSGHYAVRISAPECGGVELSLDGGRWQECRNEAGYWWFDLQGLSAGAHNIAARISGGGAPISRRDFVAG